MTKIRRFQLQLHILPEELLAVLSSMGSSVAIVTVRPVPFLAQRFNGTALHGWERLYLGASSIRLDSQDEIEFEKANSEAIRVDIGIEDGASLRQTIVSGAAISAPSLNLQVTLARRLKQISKSGMTATNPISGKECLMRSFRYTKGARAKYDEGMALLPLAGFSKLAPAVSTSRSDPDNPS